MRRILFWCGVGVLVTPIITLGALIALVRGFVRLRSLPVETQVQVDAWFADLHRAFVLDQSWRADVAAWTARFDLARPCDDLLGPV